MNELQRQRYLNAMGMETFVPRVILPHAPAPKLCVLPEPAVADNPAPERSAPDAEMPASGKAQSVGKVLQSMGAEAKPQTVRKAPQPLPNSKKNKGVKPLHLHMWQPHDALIVIDHSTPGAALPTEKLLANILSACGQLADPLPTSARIRIPSTDELARQYSQENMRLELQTWLAEEIAKRPQAALWMFGTGAGRYFLADDCAAEPFSYAPLSAETAPQTKTQALLLPSLAELLQNPELKRKLWKAIHRHDV